MLNAEWIETAVKTISSGLADRLEKENIQVYKVPSLVNKGYIVRIDVKVEENTNEQ